MEKVAFKFNLHDPALERRDLEYWLSRPPAERIAAVEFPRRQRHGNALRLQRIARVVKLSKDSD
jgi:hypothetical protein